jgi:hypothetical protein
MGPGRDTGKYRSHQSALNVEAQRHSAWPAIASRAPISSPEGLVENLLNVLPPTCTRRESPPAASRDPNAAAVS